MITYHRNNLTSLSHKINYNKKDKYGMSSNLHENIDDVILKMICDLDQFNTKFKKGRSFRNVDSMSDLYRYYSAYFFYKILTGRRIMLVSNKKKKVKTE